VTFAKKQRFRNFFAGENGVSGGVILCVAEAFLSEIEGFCPVNGAFCIFLVSRIELQGELKKEFPWELILF
jgi:hypothetical protein